MDNHTGEAPQAPARKVFWAYLTERTLLADCADSLMEVAGYCAVKGYTRLRPRYGRTDTTRNTLAQTFLSLSKNDEDVLVMLDDDHIHPYYVVQALAEANKPVIGALAFKRAKPWEPCAYVHAPGEPEGHYHALVHIPKDVLGEVDAVGHAALAVTRGALHRLMAAGFHAGWWRYEYWADGGSPSEDLYFSKICKQAGVPIYLHTGVECPHHYDAYAGHADWENFIKERPELVRAFDTEMEPVSMTKPLVSVVIPSRGRPDQLKACLNRLEATTQGYAVQPVVVLDEDDPQSFAASPVTPVVMQGDPLSSVAKWNMGAKYAAGDWLVFAADDLWWGDNWLAAALGTPNEGFIGFNDGHTDGNALSTHYMMRRDYIIQHHGGVLAVPHYHSWYVDVEATERAKRAGKYVNAGAALVEHRHPVWGTAKQDPTYERGQKWYAEDRNTYDLRKAAGFPDDFGPVLTAEEPILEMQA